MQNLQGWKIRYEAPFDRLSLSEICLAIFVIVTYFQISLYSYYLDKDCKQIKWKIKINMKKLKKEIFISNIYANLAILAAAWVFNWSPGVCLGP